VLCARDLDARLSAGFEVARRRDVQVAGGPLDEILVGLLALREDRGDCLVVARPGVDVATEMATPLYLDLLHEQDVRLKDRHLCVIDEWTTGCVYCGEEEVAACLPGSGGRLTMPLCRRHVRWAMACRRERVGKQARHLKKLLLAWCRLRGDDLEVAEAWLGY